MITAVLSRLIGALLILALALPMIALPAGARPLAPAPSVAQADLPSGCPGLVSTAPPVVAPAAFVTPVALAPDQVRLTYIGHSTFLIESPQLVRIATDYNDDVTPPVMPDIVTMNHAHATHYTLHPDPAIKLVLHGWNDDGTPARHDHTYGDVHVRSVPTNIRSFDGGTERHGNSIFIFELGGLCIAHLGHLHHTLNAQQLQDIGRVDAVLVPVDGTYTLDVDGMAEVLKAMNAPLMVPMHYFSRFTLERFLDRVRSDYAVEFAETPSVVLSRASLPAKPKILVLPGH